MPRPHTPRGPRTIKESRTGRVSWKPEKPHPLDALEIALTELRHQLPGDIEAVVQAALQTEQQLQALQQIEQDDPDGPVFRSRSSRLTRRP